MLNGWHLLTPTNSSHRVVIDSDCVSLGEWNNGVLSVTGQKTGTVRLSVWLDYNVMIYNTIDITVKEKTSNPDTVTLSIER